MKKNPTCYQVGFFGREERLLNTAQVIISKEAFSFSADFGHAVFVEGTVKTGFFQQIGEKHAAAKFGVLKVR